MYLSSSPLICVSRCVRATHFFLLLLSQVLSKTKAASAAAAAAACDVVLCWLVGSTTLARFLSIYVAANSNQ
jgi:hypothetical protein